MESVRYEEMLMLEKQLKRKISGVRRIVMRCNYGFPVVIENDCEIDGKPFPTLFWLVCPKLVKEVSRLEANGWIKKFESMIEQDQEFKRSYIQAHDVIRKLRNDVLEKETIRRIFSEMGTGGIRNLESVKCLHLHVADYLAGVMNPVGERILNMVGKPFCEDNRVICREL
ncbi:MAG: DUF501 domain-containing protein [Pseudothermotoga sp.]|nr:DUF501 domain-containing protein [Pseudothermotoga sp.]